MPRINVRLDAELRRELEAVARATGVTASDVVRKALEAYLRTRKPRENCLDIARRIGIVGVFEGLPSDLSTNPDHMEGFGE